MSDSDDTDILLLIPPNYYILNAEEKLLYDDIKTIQRRQYASLQELKSLELHYNKNLSRRSLTSEFEAMDLAVYKNEDALVMPPPNKLPTSASYQLLPPTRKAQLNHLNDRLHNMEREENVGGDIPSDISSISANTVRTQFGVCRKNKEYIGIVHSTPKYMGSAFKEQLPNVRNNINNDKDIMSDLSSASINAAIRDPCLSQSVSKCTNLVEASPTKKHNKSNKELLQTENFLLNDGMTNNENFCQQHQWDNLHMEQPLKPNALKTSRESHLNYGKSLPTEFETLPLEKSKISTYQMSKADNDLISLSEIWGKSGQATAIPTSSQTNLREEQLRRQHLEKTVRQLQARLLEYQQRLSVAIEVDRTKDNALNNGQVEIQRYIFRISNPCIYIHISVY